MTGSHDGDAPGRAGLRHQAPVERGHQSRAYERRLAAARRADDGEEARPLESPEQFFALAVAPEEEVRFGGFKGAQAGERIRRVVNFLHRLLLSGQSEHGQGRYLK